MQKQSMHDAESRKTKLGHKLNETSYLRETRLSVKNIHLQFKPAAANATHDLFALRSSSRHSNKPTRDQLASQSIRNSILGLDLLTSLGRRLARRINPLKCKSMGHPIDHIRHLDVQLVRPNRHIHLPRRVERRRHPPKPITIQPRRTPRLRPSRRPIRPRGRIPIPGPKHQRPSLALETRRCTRTWFCSRRRRRTRWARIGTRTLDVARHLHRARAKHRLGRLTTRSRACRW